MIPYDLLRFLRMPADPEGTLRTPQDPLRVPLRISQDSFALFKVPQDSPGPTRIPQDPLSFLWA
eukprot:654007-Pyramimonas_sp.AAC.1